MSVILKLFKLQIDDVYNVFKLKNLKKLLWSVAKYVFLLSLISLVLYILLIKIRILGFAVNVQLLSVVILITQVISLFFATGSIMTNLFFSKNNEILLSMPASANQIFLSKMLVIYVQEIVMNTAVALPLMLICGIYGHFGGVYFVLLPLFMLLLPLLPLSIAAFISIPVAKLLKFLKKRALISTLIILALVAVLLVFYVRALSLFSGFDVGNKQRETVGRVNEAIVKFGNSNWFFISLAKGMISPKLFYWVLMYTGIGAAALTGAIFLIRPFFFKTAMQSHENATTRAKPKKFKRQSPLVSLIRKEFLEVFRSPGNVFQYFIFTLLMPVIVVLYDSLLLNMDIVTQMGRLMISGAHLLIVVLLAMLSNIISASAISREGGNFYLMKTAPVDYYTQTGAKLIFNAIFTVSAVLLTAVVTLITSAFAANGIGAGAIVCSTVIAIFVSLAHICLSFDMDLKKPSLSWQDSADISKISGNTAKSVVWALATSIIMGLFVIMCAGAGLTVLPWVILIVASIAFCARKVYVLILRVSYQYENIEV